MYTQKAPLGSQCEQDNATDNGHQVVGFRPNHSTSNSMLDSKPISRMLVLIGRVFRLRSHNHSISKYMLDSKLISRTPVPIGTVFRLRSHNRSISKYMLDSKLISKMPVPIGTVFASDDFEMLCTRIEHHGTC